MYLLKYLFQKYNTLLKDESEEVVVSRLSIYHLTAWTVAPLSTNLSMDGDFGMNMLVQTVIHMLKFIGETSDQIPLTIFTDK